jgi:hypothetical protein
LEENVRVRFAYISRFIEICAVFRRRLFLLDRLRINADPAYVRFSQQLTIQHRPDIISGYSSKVPKNPALWAACQLAQFH